MLWSTTDSSHQMVNGTDCFNRTIKEYSYELSGKLLKASSDISDSTNPYDIWSANYNDYFYYSHDGVIAERHDDVSKFKYFTRLGRELMACNTSDNGTYFYIQNLRGDVMMLVGSNGDVSSMRDYDATGQKLAKVPDLRTDRDPFGFTGGLDVGNGLWKLGARFYDSSENSFIQQDRYMGNPSDPLSLNRYVYCGLDPVNYADPTGFTRYTVTNQQQVNGISGNLNRQALKCGVLGAGFGLSALIPGCEVLGIIGTIDMAGLAYSYASEAVLVNNIEDSSYYDIDSNGYEDYNVTCYDKDGNPIDSGTVGPGVYNDLMKYSKQDNSSNNSNSADDYTNMNVNSTNGEF